MVKKYMKLNANDLIIENPNDVELNTKTVSTVLNLQTLKIIQ